MQSEAGEALDQIILRKETERRASGGIFFWGVGNAPNREIRELVSRRETVPVVFSIMRSPPKRADMDPEAVVVWRGYVDHKGEARGLPKASLVMSRAGSNFGRSHYALICQTHDCLTLQDHGPFDHTAFRNAGPNGKSIAPSQVTALARRAADFQHNVSYRANLLAVLAGSYWVRLLDPLYISKVERHNFYNDLARLNHKKDDWTELVTRLRRPKPKLTSGSDGQFSFA